MALNKLTRPLVERSFDGISVPTRPTEPQWLRDAWIQMDREFVTGPPLTLHLPVPPLFTGVWAALRESLLAGPTDRVTREVIAAAVSVVNECPYCVDSHTASTSALGEDAAAKVLRARSVDAIGRDDLRAAAQWAAATRTPGDPKLAGVPFEPGDEPYAIGTALTFHYLNRMVCAFLKPAPAKIPSFVDRRSFMTRVIAVFPGRLLGAPNLDPGASLPFCSPSPKVPELVKLESAPHVAAGLAALAASAENAGQVVLTESCRKVVEDAIHGWDGGDPGLGSAWIREVVGSLPGDEQSAATFALVCALAWYRVDRRILAAVRSTHPTDPDLVSIAAWASMRATLRIASWI
jgi:AhpD family alkylhydroperoxidase